MNSDKKILIVDDVSQNLQVLAAHLAEDNYSISMAKSGEGALAAAASNSPDLILLDISMPEMNGFEVCKRLKQQSETRNIPIIFLTARTETDDIVNGFKLGAVDYITKPFNQLELKVRVQNHLNLFYLQQELIKKNIELEHASITDPLTKILNRRGMIQRLKEEYSRLNRHAARASIAICDIDNFKKINDTYGHDYGDYVLTETCEVISTYIRPSDLFARWGGEEFLLFFPDCISENDGKHLCEKICKAVSSHTFSYKGVQIGSTISIGTAMASGDSSIDNDIKLADSRLYKAKTNGKNRVV